MEATIHYESKRDDVRLAIRAEDAALPSTCKVEEVDEEVPAQPARMVKKKILRCPQPAAPQPGMSDSASPSETSEVAIPLSQF